MSFHIESIPNQANKPAILLRQAWRDGQRIRKKTLANLSKLPPEVVDGFRTVLKGGLAVQDPSDLLRVERSWAHGHVAAVLGSCRSLGLERILHRRRSRERDLALAAIVARVLAPDSKLATARRLSPDTADSSLGALLGLGPVSGNEMLALLDWLLARQRWIETSLANRHLQDATLILYDVSCSYLEGRLCPLAACGYNRDGKQGKQQIVCGLLCAADGCPLAVEVFPGNTADPTTVGPQVERIRTRFGIARITLVGDRGMLTTARLREDLQPAGLDWISALKNQSVRTLLKRPKPLPGQDPDAVQAPLRPGELVPDQVAEIRSPDYPGERLLVCLNPRLRAERARKREELLQATERILEGIAAQLRRGREPLRGRDAIHRRLGRELNRKKVGKHFEIVVGDGELGWSRKPERIAAEAQLDGIYIVRTSLEEEALGAEAAVQAYKSLAGVERAFRTSKDHLRIRPIHVYSEDHVRGHVFLCMLAYYVEWHMRQRLAPLLFQDDDPAAARARRDTPVEPAEVSERAQRKADTKTTPEGFPVHSFPTLLGDLANLVLNRVSLPTQAKTAITIATEPTPLQRRAFDLLGVDPTQTVSITVTGSELCRNRRNPENTTSYGDQHGLNLP